MKNYIKLNNQVMQKVNGFYQLDKDKIAVEEFQQAVNVTHSIHVKIDLHG